MKYYLAPMEGLTTFTFRMAYHKHYKDFDRYFTPFLANKNLNTRELNEILPEHNEGMCLIPQILSNRSDDFLDLAKRISSFGYTSVNLNLGCPSGTVVAKKRGSGFLSQPQELDRFLGEIYEKSPVKISIKTRIGIESVDEWGNILNIYRKYPLEELIVHPRLQKQFYKGTPHLDAFAAAVETMNCPVCYNGDIVNPETLQKLTDRFPQTDTVMIGRGIFQQPWLLDTFAGAGTFTAKELDTLRAFHNSLLEGYMQLMSGDQPTLFKMKDFWTFLIQGFPGYEKQLKKIRKATRISEYKIAANEFFVMLSENI